MNACFTLLVSLLVLSANVFSQWDSYMYWEIRQRFLDKFIRVGEGHGMSIPVSVLQRDPQKLVFQDESHRHVGWYLAMLTTEHELLKYYGYPTGENEHKTSK